MTVAVAILAATAEGAVRPIEGRALVRRLAEVAWAGGAVPIVVVAADPQGAVAIALAGAPVTLAEPAPPDGGPVAQICRGIDVARAQVGETDAVLVWPARLAWVDPETVTSLIEAHGTDPQRLLRPGYRGAAGWPALLPLAYLERLRGLAAARTPDELVDDLVAAGVPLRTLELGDPGVVLDLATPLEALPPYEGPAGPASGLVHEWGAAAADQPDDGPLDGPVLAPLEPATDPR